MVTVRISIIQVKHQGCCTLLPLWASLHLRLDYDTSGINENLIILYEPSLFLLFRLDGFNLPPTVLAHIFAGNCFEDYPFL